jgi:hypothetical protein
MQLPSVSVSVQSCSVHYKGYNMIRVTTVEEGTTIGTTALVYWQLHSSLYTGAVQGYWSTPDWSDRRQGCRQVSTVEKYSWSIILINILKQCVDLLLRAVYNIIWGKILNSLTKLYCCNLLYFDERLILNFSICFNEETRTSLDRLSVV